MYLINEVSRRVGLSQKRIREYEKEGFILPEREANTNNRLYSDFEVSQIRRITHLIHERGFTLACLRNLMVLAPCWNIFACLDKEACAAYTDPHRGCWEIRQQGNTLCPGPCERCAVYLNREFAAKRVLEPAGGSPIDQEK
ncbi:MAG: MerR family transcriptional regulator [Proteobacteria bacterium]|nr:MerR family transcriptional regulator [Pseudomonadota bacterium]MBU1451807.1 MerR family transcriptional regulator [Pseudomonadota bacterium]MBU2470688.1 MerR family transcriptional regulator [Pseudomonadota bacterium]MBU2516519.1 MerR family transcriptional regulator [Pseudomonadota bacterium]